MYAHGATSVTVLFNTCTSKCLFDNRFTLSETQKQFCNICITHFNPQLRPVGPGALQLLRSLTIQGPVST